MFKISVTPRWITLTALITHVTFAILVAGSVLVMLLGSSRGADDVYRIGPWIDSVGAVVESIGMERRRPYVFAMLGAFAGLPLAVGWWDARCVLRGRETSALGFVAPSAVVAWVVLYVAAVELILRFGTTHVTITASNHIWFSYVIVVLYGILYVPVAFLATWVVRRLYVRRQP